MKTRIELSREEVEEIVTNYVRSSMNLYTGKATTNAIWSTDGTGMMSVTIDDSAQEDGT